MRTDAYDPARVRDPAIELLLSHTVTLTERTARLPAGPSTTACARRPLARQRDQAELGPFRIGHDDPRPLSVRVDLACVLAAELLYQRDGGLEIIRPNIE